MKGTPIFPGGNLLKTFGFSFLLIETNATRKRIVAGMIPNKTVHAIFVESTQMLAIPLMVI